MNWLIGRIDAQTTGARSVQRLVESTVSRLISDSFIKGKIKAGGDYSLCVGEGDALDLKSRE